MNPVNKEALRILVADIGYEETSKRTGIKPGTLRQWSKRGQWNVTRSHAQEAVTTVTRSPALAHSDIMQERKQRSGEHLSKYIEDASERLANSQGDLKHSRPGKDIVAMRSGIWPEQQGQAQFSLNVLNLGGSVQIGIRNTDHESVSEAPGTDNP